MPTITQSTISYLVQARKALIALWTLTLLIALTLVPSAFAATQADWQFNEVVRTVSGVSYETLTAVVAAARLAIGGLMVATAAVLLTRAPQPGALLAALALMTFPFTAGLFGNAGSSTLAAPWNGLLDAVVTVLSIAGGLSILALLFLFPNGRFHTAPLRIIALAGLLLVAAAILITSIIEEGWWVFAIALLFTVLTACSLGVMPLVTAHSSTRRTRLRGLPTPRTSGLFSRVQVYRERSMRERSLPTSLAPTFLAEARSSRA